MHSQICSATELPPRKGACLVKFGCNSIVMIALVLLATMLLFERFVKKLPDAVSMVLLLAICIVIIIGMIVARNK